VKNVLYWDEWKSELGCVFMSRTTEGLSYVGGPNETFIDMQKWAVKYFPEYSLTQNEDLLLPYKTELTAYLNGKAKSFMLPLDLRGTAFQLAVWKELQAVQYGETVPYSWIAEKIGNPQAVRAVGSAIGSNPVMIIVPCHRVIGKNNMLTGFRGGLNLKTFLLKHEGVSVDEKGKISK